MTYMWYQHEQSRQIFYRFKSYLPDTHRTQRTAIHIESTPAAATRKREVLLPMNGHNSTKNEGKGVDLYSA